jgi:phage gpG-like protein
MNAAKKELGEGARPRQITMRAFEMMDEAGGGQKGAAAIPARPFIMFQEEDEYAVQEVFFDWLDNRVQLHWGSGA